jgi:DNA-binding XRE family transcriptional regulator
MVQLPDKQDIRLEFESEFNHERNQLIGLRAQLFTQQEMADALGKSLRTIQHFEKGRNYDPYILTGYRVLSEI